MSSADASFVDEAMRGMIDLPALIEHIARKHGRTERESREWLVALQSDGIRVVSDLQRMEEDDWKMWSGRTGVTVMAQRFVRMECAKLLPGSIVTPCIGHKFNLSSQAEWMATLHKIRRYLFHAAKMKQELDNMELLSFDCVAEAFDELRNDGNFQAGKVFFFHCC